MTTPSIFLNRKLLLYFALALFLAGCSKDTVNVAPGQEEVNFRSSNFNFHASLKGDNEVPAVISNAAGEAIVRISKDESSIYYKIMASNLENVFASHFHLAPAGVNGPVLVTLYTNPLQPSGPQNGVLKEGIITPDEIGAQKFSDLINHIRSGNIYVNVHTSASRSGEIRGQVQ